MTNSELITSRDSINQSNPQTIVKVAISMPLRRLFDYSLANDYPITPQPGMRVEVPFGSTSKIGIIDSINQEQSKLEQNKIKSIAQIIDNSPLINDTLISLYRWMCDYYHAPAGEVWQTMLPTFLLKGKPAEQVRVSRWVITQEGKDIFGQKLVPKNAVKQRVALQLLIQQPDGILHDRLKILS